MGSLTKKSVGIVFVFCAFLQLPMQRIASTALAQGTLSAGPRPAIVLAADGIPVKVPGTCNSTVFSQVPGHGDYFIGRRGTESGACADFNPESLALFKMDWTTHTLDFMRYVLKPPLQVHSGAELVSVRSIYDPSVALYNGEFWVAFECAAPQFIGASACIGPFDFDRGEIDPKRSSLLISAGSTDTKSPYSYTAAVPNLVSVGNRLYVYWSAIEIRKATRKWDRIAIRGAELAQESSGPRRLWVFGSVGSAVVSHDPSRNVEVLGPDPADPYSNQTADLKGAYAAGGYIYLIASLGGRGPERNGECTTAKGTSAGCFRMQVFRAAIPLGANVFSSRLVSPAPPTNPAAYQRFFLAPDRALKIIGEFFNPSAGPAYSPNTMQFSSPQILIT